MNFQETLFPGYTIGEDAYQNIPAVCAPFGKKAAIIGGKHALAAAEEKIRRAVEGSGIEVTGTYWYGGEASVENIAMLEPQVKEADMLFAVGGGKAIDTVKVLAHMTHRPFFTFPTIASTCASCTSLGILYHPDGSLREYSFSKIPPNHIFIDPQIIADAPVKYLWAGMGDTMAKHFECTTSSRGDVPSHSDAMGIALSSMCAEPILRWGQKAMEDCKAHQVTYELTEIILSIIVSTGLVSNFVQVDYTTGLAPPSTTGSPSFPAPRSTTTSTGKWSPTAFWPCSPSTKSTRSGTRCWPLTGPSGCPPGFLTSTPSRRTCLPWRRRPFRASTCASGPMR